MNNQKGLTLVELLAAVTILFIVSAIIYGVFFTFNNNYDRIVKKNSMDQTANIVLATIKKYHESNDYYQIRYDDVDKDAYIGKDTADNTLGDSNFDMEIKVGYPAAAVFTITKVDSYQPLAIYLKLTNQKGQTYEIETIVKRY